MKRSLAIAVALLAATLFGACLSTPPPMPALAHATVANDFHTYQVRRVGILPFRGPDTTPERGLELQESFFAELSASTPYEVVMLDASDLEEVELSEPYRRGWYKPKTIIRLSRRYSLDALFFGTVTQERFYPPQNLGLQVDLVAAETGLVIWSSSIHLDANDPRVLDGLEAFYEEDWRVREQREDWRYALVSPLRFGRFAAFQVAALL